MKEQRIYLKVHTLIDFFPDPLIRKLPSFEKATEL